jgi:hypothetical protein
MTYMDIIDDWKIVLWKICIPLAKNKKGKKKDACKADVFVVASVAAIDGVRGAVRGRFKNMLYYPKIYSQGSS